MNIPLGGICYTVNIIPWEGMGQVELRINLFFGDKIVVIKKY
jgi:hypothetical protein